VRAYLIALFISFVGMTASARAADVEATPQLLKQFTAEHVDQALRALGADDIRPATAESPNVINFKLAGSAFAASLHVCGTQDTPGCRLLALHAVIELNPKVDWNLINEFNKTQVIASTVLFEEQEKQSAILVRSMISDGGVSQDNLVTNIRVFSEGPEFFSRHVASQRVASGQRVGPQSAQSGAAAPVRLVAKSPTPEQLKKIFDLIEFQPLIPRSRQ
jgi:hypothetical protein